MKQFVKIFPALVGVLTLIFMWPLWQGYLLIDNKLWPSWDPGAHFNDGLMLFLQLKELDIFSFLYQLIHFPYWLPTHPLLACLTQIFFFGNADAVLFLNFIFVSLTGVALVELTRRKTKGDVTSMVLSGLLYLALMLGLQQSGAWIDNMNRIMLEPLCFCLTILSLTVWSLGYFKWGSILLFLTFMTKIHYGLYLIPAFLLSSDSKKVFLTLLKSAQKLLKTRSGMAALGFVLLGVVLISFRVIHGPWEGDLFGKHISFNRYHNALWVVLFSCMIFVLLVLRKNWKEIARESPRLYFILKFTAIPYAIYYLLPIEHKIKALLEHMVYTTRGTEISLFEKYTHLLRVSANDYFGMKVTLVFLALALVAFFINLKKKKINLLTLTPLVCVPVFILMMGRIALFREARFAVSLVAILFSMLFVWVLIAAEKNKKLSIAMSICLLGLMGFLIPNWVKPTMVAKKTAPLYLAVNTHDWNSALEKIDFSEPTILWGLGLDHLVPRIVTDFLKRVPHLSSYTRRPNYYINDLGYEGMRAPEQFILSNWKENRVNQLLFYLPGLEGSPGIYKNLLHSKVVFESRHWLLLRRQ